jgi:outer membrane murein-binding lipoprotein Lpp
MKKRIYMNKIIKLSVATSLVALSLNAGMTNDELSAKVEKLEKQLSELSAKQNNRSDELEEKIEQVETSTMTDKINFGLDFRTRVDGFTTEDAAGNDGSDNNIWSNRLRINMDADITDDMKFTGRLSMYKNWSDSNINVFSNMDPMQGRRPSDSGIFVERAYVDWTALKGQVPVTLTIGRQPSSDGPSHQFKDNTVRKATYSALSFDGAADGVVATAALNKVTGVDGMALRVGYGKGYQDSSNMSYVGNPDGVADSNVLGAFLDTGLGIEGSLLQVSAVQARDVVSNTTNLAGVSTNGSIGDVTLYTAMIEFTNINSSGLDLFAHYAISQANPNGESGALAVDTNNDGIPDTDMSMGLLSTDMGAGISTDQKDGNAYWIGARYALPFEAMNNPKIGVEYNRGSKNWFSFTQGSNDLTNKLATRGTATEVYYIQPINRYAHLRLGATMIDYEYTGTGYQIGEPMEVSDMGAGVIDKLQNYYLLFNVAY